MTRQEWNKRARALLADLRARAAAGELTTAEREALALLEHELGPA